MELGFPALQHWATNEQISFSAGWGGGLPALLPGLETGNEEGLGQVCHGRQRLERLCPAGPLTGTPHPLKVELNSSSVK